MKGKKSIYTLKGFYLFAFFGLGSLFPLLSVYLEKEQNLTGTQIGMILSVGPIVLIFFQPIWGFICDKTKTSTKVLTLAVILTGITGMGYLLFENLYLFILTAILIAVFQSAIIPVSDSITISYMDKVNYSYGNVRLFGSLGYGIAVFIMGKFSESLGLNIIFYSFFLSLVIASIFAWLAPKEQNIETTNLKEGIHKLITYKKYLIFLLITFMIFSPNIANNNYFGLFIENRGGTYATIGIAFMIAVCMEIPFMRFSGLLIGKLGIMWVILLTGIASLFRWTLYFFEPSMTIIFLSTIIQGFSLGLFIPAALQYIREIAPTNTKASAITIYSAVGNGIGNCFCTLIGGFLYDTYGIFSIYLFFASLSCIGIVITTVLIAIEKKNVITNEVTNI